MNNFAQENNLQCYPDLCGPTLHKGITSIILVHSWQKTFLSKITYTTLCLQSWENIAYRNSHPDVLCKKGVLRNFAKFTGKYLCQSLFSNKVAGLRPAALLQDSGTSVFLWILWNFQEYLFSRTPLDNCFCIGKSYTQCCPNMPETTLHKKITCAILALSMQQRFWRKLTYTILSWSAWAKIACIRVSF